MFPMPDNKWARLLAFVTGLVNQKLLLQNEYLAAENRILRAHLPVRMRLSDPERSTVATGNSTDLENQSLPHIFLTMLSNHFGLFPFAS
jgi:hypothetical protein